MDVIIMDGMDQQVSSTNGQSNAIESRGAGLSTSTVVSALLGLIWLLGFSLYFHSQGLPNQPDWTRPLLWLHLPELLAVHLPGGGGVNRGSGTGRELSLAWEEQRANSGWRNLPQRFDLIGVGGVILLGACGWGALLLRLLRITPRGSAEHLALAGGLGLSAWSLITLACGWWGWLSRPLLAVLLLAGPIAHVAGWWLDRPRQSGVVTSSPTPEAPQWKRRFLQESLLPAWVLLAVLPFLLAMVLGSLLPPTDFDVKEYHLGGPKEFFQQGRISFLPHNVYTSFPFLTEMLSLSAMVLQDDWARGARAGQFVLMAFAPLSALAIYALGCRLGGPLAGWWGVLVHLTTPWTYRISIIAYTEGGLSYYLVASLLGVVLLRDELRCRPCDTHRGVLLLTGLLAGSAAACKYPGLVLVTIPISLSATWLSWRHSHGMRHAALLDSTDVAVARKPDAVESTLDSPAQEAATSVQPATSGRPVSPSAAYSTVDWMKGPAWVALGVVLSFGPWLMKNTIETGNPVYPLCYRWFGGVDWDEAADAKWRAGHAPEVLKLPGWQAIPVDLWRQAIDVAAVNDWGSPLLWGLAPVVWLCRETRRRTWGIWVFVGWVFLCWWGLTHRIDRFWVPMIPAVALLAGLGASRLRSAWNDVCDARNWPGWMSGVLLGLPIGLLVLFNLAFATSPLGGYNAYLLDESLLAERTTTHSLAAIHALEFEVPPRILMVGEAEIFDAQFELCYNTVFDRSLFEDWFAAPDADGAGTGPPLRPAAEIRERLVSEGITHLFVNWSEVLRYRLTYGYTEFVSADKFDTLVREGLLRPVPLSGELIYWDDLDPQRQAEVLRWSPELRHPSRGTFRRWALYEVINSPLSPRGLAR